MDLASAEAFLICLFGSVQSLVTTQAINSLFEQPERAMRRGGQEIAGCWRLKCFLLHLGYEAFHGLFEAFALASFFCILNSSRCLLCKLQGKVNF